MGCQRGTILSLSLGGPPPPPVHLNHMEKQLFGFAFARKFSLQRACTLVFAARVEHTPFFFCTTIPAPHPNFPFSFSSQKLKHMQTYASPFLPNLSIVLQPLLITWPFICSLSPVCSPFSLILHLVRLSHLSPFPSSFAFTSHGTHRWALASFSSFL